MRFGGAIIISVSLLVTGCGSGGIRTTTSGVAGVVVRAATATDVGSLNAAFSGWGSLPASCPVQPVPGSVHVATISATGVSWAIGKFGPIAACQLIANGQAVNPLRAVPFVYAADGHPEAVFEQQANGPWRMNAEGGTAFPCPPGPGVQASAGNGALPEDVVKAWGMTYAQGCANVSYPRAP